MISIEELLYAVTLTVSVILIYSEQMGITDYLPSLYHYLIPMLINPVTLLAVPILRNDGIFWGTIVLFISMLAIFWEATLFFNFIITVCLTWIITGSILLLKKIFKDNHIEYFLKINVIYGFLVFVSVAFLVVFIILLSEKNSLWVNNNLSLLKQLFPIALIPVFFFYSKNIYRSITHYLEINKPSLSREMSTVIEKPEDSAVINKK